MSNRTSHLSDQELILAADGELPPRRLMVVDAHLARCAGCRVRKEQLEETARAFARAYQDQDARPSLDAPPLDARRHLEATLADAHIIPRWMRTPVGARRGAVVLWCSVRVHSHRTRWRSPATRARRTSLPQLTPGDVRPVTLDELCASVSLPDGCADVRAASGAARLQHGPRA